MKLVWTSIKWLCGVAASIIMAYMAVEAWSIKNANTVVEPVKARVVVLEERQKLDQERNERESFMIRSSLDKIHSILIERK